MNTANQTHTPLDDIIDIQFNPFGELSDNLTLLWQSLNHKFRHGYTMVADSLFDELLVRGSEQQLNDALYNFVVKHVQMIHDLHLELHHDWLRLYATVYFRGIFVKVACNFRLVSIELTGDIQRVVFEQLSNTDILELHSKTWWQTPAIKTALSTYRRVYKHDPLAMILQKITVKEEPFAVHKGRFIYVDIGRYFAKSPEIIGYFRKAQVNHAYTTEGNLVARVRINFEEVIGLGRDDDIISEKDNPNRKKK